VVPQSEMQPRICQRQARERFAYVSMFSGDSLEEFLAHRCIVKQVPHFDARAGRAIPGANWRQVAALAVNLGPDIAAFMARLQCYAGHAAYRSQGSAAKTQRADPEQVVSVVELAGGVTGEGQFEVFGLNSTSVIHDDDAFGPALVEFDVDARAAGVDGV